jgi:thiosulfate/3-mercaptopyruvate sulfurtransferase
MRSGFAATVAVNPDSVEGPAMAEASGETNGPLVEASWLLERLGAPRLTVVDCHFKLGEPGAGERAWREGHIPGAAFLDVDRDLAAEPGERGRHPLPETADFQAAARRAGIGRDSMVVAYDEAGEGGAVRLWWLLRHFGHERVAVLNGGLRAWRESGGPLRAGDEEVEEGDFVARAREGDTAAAEELLAGEHVLLDARVPERFRGEVEPIDPVAGHIPGALNVPFAEIAPEGRFPSRGELRRRLESVGATPGRELVAYCGSGITSCTLVLAAELAGLPARLYPGSWSEWSRHGYPVARHDNARSTESRSSGPGGVRSR